MSQEQQISSLQNQITSLRAQITQRTPMGLKTNQPISIPKIPVWVVIGGGAGIVLSYLLNLPFDQAIWLVLGSTFLGIIFGKFILPKILL